MGAIWDGIVNAFAELIKIFASVGGGNTAIGIILFTIFVRTLILPLTLKAVRSSRSMQQLQPLIKDINKKYQTKPGERLSQEKSTAKQAEIMGLYKKYNVNPTASCLPILIQIPIFFAVYGAVTKSVGTSDVFMKFVQNSWNAIAPDAATATNTAALANSGILWIKDLTLPDPLFILPILMVIFQFASSNMAIPRGGGADEQQKRLNSIMKWTPLIFGFTALNFPAGPVLYWTVSSLYAAIQQYCITGWGSLGDLPGLGFLPEKKLPKIELKERVIDDSKPRKKTLMERLAEQQERLAQERGGQADGSADAGKPAVNNFGRRSDAGPVGSSLKKSNDEVEESEESEEEESPAARESAPPGKSKSGNYSYNARPALGSPPKSRPKDEDAVRDAYRQLGRPPKKVPPGGNNNRSKKK